MTLCITWSDDRIAELTKLHAEGFSSSQIAFKLGGTTRNACIGKIHRLGLAPPEKKIQSSAPRAPRTTKHKPTEPKIKFRIVDGGGGTFRMIKSKYSADIIALRCVEVVPKNKGLLELERFDCRYPTRGGDDGEPITFCGHPTFNDTSWCIQHHALCMTPPRPYHRGAA